jgi:hypothetical protein
VSAVAPRLAEAGVEIRDWGGSLAVVYAHRMNSTHLVSAETASVLRMAAAGRLTAEQAAEKAAVVDALLRFGLLTESP